ncbi:hypothetical protein, partial [Xanthomonas oryzae]|uniref:hypothetical protein n=1 Tax=Xanthomonas oryzae TaxID=347 RepID=UPI00095B493E
MHPFALEQDQLGLRIGRGLRLEALLVRVPVSYSGNKATVQPQARDRTDSLASNFDQTHGLPRADLGDPPGPNG